MEQAHLAATEIIQVQVRAFCRFQQFPASANENERRHVYALFNYSWLDRIDRSSLESCGIRRTILAEWRAQRLVRANLPEHPDLRRYAGSYLRHRQRQLDLDIPPALRRVHRRN